MQPTPGGARQRSSVVRGVSTAALCLALLAPLSAADAPAEDGGGGDSHGQGHGRSAAHARVHGAITAVDASGKTITVQPRGGDAAVTLTVSDSTKIVIDQTPGTLSDLKVGDRVSVAEAEGTHTATSVHVHRTRSGHGGDTPATASGEDHGSDHGVTPSGDGGGHASPPSAPGPANRSP